MLQGDSTVVVCYMPPVASANTSANALEGLPIELMAVEQVYERISAARLYCIRVGQSKQLQHLLHARAKSPFLFVVRYPLPDVTDLLRAVHVLTQPACVVFVVPPEYLGRAGKVVSELLTQLPQLLFRVADVITFIPAASPLATTTAFNTLYACRTGLTAGIGLGAAAAAAADKLTRLHASPTPPGPSRSSRSSPFTTTMMTSEVEEHQRYYLAPPNACELGLGSLQDVKLWLQGEQPPTWELVYHNHVPWLKQHERLLERVQQCVALEALSHGQLCWIPVRALIPGCGTTTTLRSVAARLAQSQDKVYTVYFAPSQLVLACALSGPTDAPESAHAEPRQPEPQVVNWAQLIDPTAANSPVVFFFDRDAPGSHFSSLQVWMKSAAGRSVRSPVVAVVVTTGQDDDARNGRHVHSNSDQYSPLTVEPFLHPEDADVVCSAFSTAFETAKLALEACRKHMHSAAATLTDRHLFVFGLTALRGTFKPVSSLVVSALDEANAKRDFAEGLIATLVFLSAFSTQRDDSELPLDTITKFLEDLPQLESLVVRNPANTRVRLMHPIFGRFCVLMMQHRAPLARGGCDGAGGLPEAPGCTFVSHLHATVGEFLRSHVPRSLGHNRSYLQQTVNRLVASRLPGRFNSPLLSVFAASTHPADDKPLLEGLLSFSNWPVQLEPGYRELQLRHWTHQDLLRSEKLALLEQWALDLPRPAAL
jgi:hypothetical protein